MPRLTLRFALVLLLAACGGGPSGEVRLRDPAVPVRSIAGFEPVRMAGDWAEVAALNAPGSPGCAPGRLSVRPAGNALQLEGTLCLGGRAERISARAVPSGPGRFAVSGQAEDWWVIWADWDMRTLVLAAPSGRFGVVLDRGRIAPDRMKAAREILAFNGYTVSALR